MLNVRPYDPPFAPYEGQRASKSGRSRNEGIPEVGFRRVNLFYNFGIHAYYLTTLHLQEPLLPEVRLKQHYDSL